MRSSKSKSKNRNNTKEDLDLYSLGQEVSKKYNDLKNWYLYQTMVGGQK